MSGNTKDRQPNGKFAPDGAETAPLSTGQDYVPFHFPDFTNNLVSGQQSPSSEAGQETLTLSIELGRQLLDVQAVRELTQGSRVMLQQLATEPVELYVKQQCVGQGELLMRDNKVCIRITALTASASRRSA